MSDTLGVKEIGQRAGALVVGVAAVDAFNAFVPAGHRPEDILLGAQSVVVAGCQGPTAGAWRCPDHRVMEITGYDFRENVAIHVMCDFIESACGYLAIQAPSLPTSGHTPPMSMMLAAVLSGLGTRSLAANIILHPDYGLLYYAALITTMPLEPDHPLAQDVCPAPPCIQMYRQLGTTPCLAACTASEGGCLDGRIGEDGRIAYSYYDRERWGLPPTTRTVLAPGSRSAGREPAGASINASASATPHTSAPLCSAKACNSSLACCISSASCVVI